MNPYRGMFDHAPVPAGESGRFSERQRTLTGSADLLEGSGRAALGGTAGLRGNVDGPAGIVGSGALYGTGQMGASGQYSTGPEGLTAGAQANMLAGFGAQARLGGDRSLGSIPGVSDPVTAGGSVNASGFVGTDNRVGGGVTLGRNGAAVNGNFQALVGAEASAAGEAHLGPFAFRGGASGIAGAGVGASGEFGFRDGHFRMGGSAMGALGLGGRLSGGVDVNYRQIGQMAGSAWRGARGLFSRGLESGGREMSNGPFMAGIP